MSSDASAATLDAALVERIRDLEATKSATLNMLEDLDEERRSYEANQRATYNLLDDLDEERERFIETQRATTNILEDLSVERDRSELTQRATTNILEDLSDERERSQDTQRATLNVLDDLAEEKTRTERANTSLAQEVGLRRSAEQEITTKATALARSNDELSQFAYVASHDLQEPLRTVRGAVNYLAKAYADKISPEDEKYVKFALDGAARMQNLIEDLLELSRVTTHGEPPAPLDPAVPLARALANVAGAVEAAHGSVVTSAMPQVLADESQLAQLFQNLIGNGIKFHGDAPPRVEVSAAREGAMVHFRVRDNGIGIDAQYHDRVFVIFQRLHGRDKYAGTGIGLAVAKKVIERHGGRIWIESAVGAGSTFHFTLVAAGESL
ncbi:MAG: sensor histidine kinase [Thermoplasmatota archaeon]